MLDLKETAKRELRKNFVQTQEGTLLMAGSHQFRTFWVRDFCFSVPGLLASGEADLVQRQIEICFKYQREDGLLARGFDVVNPKFRVACHSFGLQNLKKFNYQNRPLIPEYLGEHGTPAVDSNLLVLLVVIQWTEHTKNKIFFKKYSQQMLKALDFVWQSQRGGLLQQPGFSDWQDSARREGATFYLNLLFLKVLKGLGLEIEADREFADQARERLFLNSGFAQEFKDRLWSSFFDASVGLFSSQADLSGAIKKQYSLETQLWCIEDGFFVEQISREQLWHNLRRSELLRTAVGRPVWPEYEASEISWTTKAVGLRHYHDGFCWSWLMAETLKVARLMGDSEYVEALTSTFVRLVGRDQTICEIYEADQEMLSVSRLLYRSEQPFSWGAAKLCEALSVEKMILTAR